MNLTPVHHIRTWASAKRTAAYIRNIAKCYELQEVIETFPSGKQSTGVITRFVWNSELCALDADGNYCEGDWMIFVAYDDSNLRFGSWTSWEALTFTGEKRK